MFLIRRIYDSRIPRNKKAISSVLEILHAQFPLLTEEELAKLPDQLQDPVKYRFRSILFVAEDSRGNTKGFALLMQDPQLKFCYLDFISTKPGGMGRGIGSSLYERVREEARAMGAIGIFFECLPDDPALCRDPAVLKNNAARLRFYERYGARPIAGTLYETPLQPGGDNPPYLVVDPLGAELSLDPKSAREIVGAILDRKYKEICPPEYVTMVLESFRDDPIRLRPPRYLNSEASLPISTGLPRDQRIALVINDRQAVHHVRERGYVESPVRIRSIVRELDRTVLFERIPPRDFSELHLKEVHSTDFVEYIKNVCKCIEPGESIYPYVFPIRNAARPPQDLTVGAGYYCIDTFTPLNQNAFVAAKRSVDCALTAASCILEGYRLAYALVRPPGHHAEKRTFGGFCYFNSGSIAAQYLSRHGRVAILDIDYHHGNGTQDIFYARSDVLTLSIHAHPNFAYPYFSGFEEERGEGPGQGFNWNIPLPENLDAQRYRDCLRQTLQKIAEYRPVFLVLALGLDTARNDPTGSWDLRAGDFELNGRMIGSLRLPTLVVQEGGYSTRVLGVNARRFFQGLWAGAFSQEGG